MTILRNPALKTTLTLSTHHCMKMTRRVRPCRYTCAVFTEYFTVDIVELEGHLGQGLSDNDADNNAANASGTYNPALLASCH